MPPGQRRRNRGRSPDSLRPNPAHPLRHRKSRVHSRPRPARGSRWGQLAAAAVPGTTRRSRWLVILRRVALPAIQSTCVRESRSELGIPHGPAASSQPHASSNANSRKAAVRWSSRAARVSRQARANTFDALDTTRLGNGRMSLPAASSASTIGDRPRAIPSPSTAADSAGPNWLNRSRRGGGARSRPRRGNQVDQQNSLSSVSAASHSIKGCRAKSEGLRSDDAPLRSDGEHTGNTISLNNGISSGLRAASLAGRFTIATSIPSRRRSGSRPSMVAILTSMSG